MNYRRTIVILCSRRRNYLNDRLLFKKIIIFIRKCCMHIYIYIFPRRIVNSCKKFRERSIRFRSYGFSIEAEAKSLVNFCGEN